MVSSFDTEITWAFLFPFFFFFLNKYRRKMHIPFFFLNRILGFSICLLLWGKKESERRGGRFYYIQSFSEVICAFWLKLRCLEASNCHVETC